MSVILWDMTEQDLRDRGVDGDGHLVRLAVKLGVSEAYVHNDRQRKQLYDRVLIDQRAAGAEHPHPSAGSTATTATSASSWPR